MRVAKGLYVTRDKGKVLFDALKASLRHAYVISVFIKITIVKSSSQCM